MWQWTTNSRLGQYLADFLKRREETNGTIIAGLTIYIAAAGVLNKEEILKKLSYSS
jgi:hypothetical protein